MQLLRPLLTVTMVDSILPVFVITYSGVRAVSFDAMCYGVASAIALRTIDALTSKRTTSKRTTNQPAGSEKPKEKVEEDKTTTTATNPTVCHVNVFPPSVTTITNSKDSSTLVTKKEDQPSTASSTPTKVSEKDGSNTAVAVAASNGGVLGLFSRPQAPQAKAQLPPPICKHAQHLLIFPTSLMIVKIPLYILQLNFCICPTMGKDIALTMRTYDYIIVRGLRMTGKTDNVVPKLLRRRLTVTMVDSILPVFVITYSGVRAVSFDALCYGVASAIALRTIDALTSKRTTNQPAGSEKPKEKVKEKEKVEEEKTTTTTNPTVCHVNVFPSVTTITNSKDSSTLVISTKKEDDQTAPAAISTPTKAREKSGLFSRPQAPKAKALPLICEHVFDFYSDVKRNIALTMRTYEYITVRGLCMAGKTDNVIPKGENIGNERQGLRPTSADNSNISDDGQNPRLRPPAALLHMPYRGSSNYAIRSEAAGGSGDTSSDLKTLSYGVASAIALRTIDALVSKQPNPSVCHVDFPSVTTITNSKDSSTLVISTKKEDQAAPAAAAISTPTKVREKSGLFSRPQAPKAKALPLICEHVFDFYSDCAHASEKKCEEIQNPQASPQGQSDHSNLTQGPTSADISNVDSDDRQNPPLRAPAELLLLSYHGNTDEIENADDTYDESSNSAHGLDSIVQDSVSPETVKDQAQISVAHPRDRISLVREQEEFGENAEGIKSPLLISNNGVRASQLEGINLQVVLNPSEVRRITRSQQYEAWNSNEGMEDEADNYIFGPQEHQQNRIAEELQNTIREGVTLGIKFDDMGVKRMKKMIEKEA
ncbi:hypothetical protein RHSIM_Rhsim08G0017800 [Rhododendron simsii]|uniref:Uncharacterized protein n=1 Tax=Rhododendron simsii TaxID=118357 RepID=A0A834LHT4_RHOSS|nr:hypothetical protein RHSIM_Rhsim08G0017800 [Rhododendron simsii]